MVHLCSECNKTYSSPQSLWNHRAKFHNSIKIKEKKQKIKLKKLQETIKDLKKNLKGHLVINNNTTHPNTVNNNTINNNQIINNNNIIIKFGEEDIDKLSRDEVKQILNSGVQGFNKLVEIVHCNSKYPEYNNIKITNLKDKYCKVHDGTEFISQNKKDKIQDLITSRNSNLHSLHDQFKADTTEKHKRIKKLIDKIDQCLENEINEENDKELTKYYKSICEEITLLLYNKGSSGEQ